MGPEKFNPRPKLNQMYNSRLFGGVKMLIGIVKCKDNW